MFNIFFSVENGIRSMIKDGIVGLCDYNLTVPDCTGYIQATASNVYDVMVVVTLYLLNSNTSIIAS